MYIDEAGNEREYWLDSIYEEALTTRDTYCASMLSAAYALQAMGRSHKSATATTTAATALSSSASPPADNFNNYVAATAGMGMGVVPPVYAGVAPTANTTAAAAGGGFNARMVSPPQGGHTGFMGEVGVGVGSQHHNNGVGQNGGTMEMQDGGFVAPPSSKEQPSPVPPLVGETKTAQRTDGSKERPSPAMEPRSKTTQKTTLDKRESGGSKPKSKPSSKEKQQSPPSDPLDDVDPNSALASALGALFALFFSMVWFIVVGLPLRIFKTLLTLLVLGLSMGLLWLYLADDGGAWEMGAGVDYEYNAPGIF